MNVEVFAQQNDLLGEGPLWCAEEQALYWIDIAYRRLYRQTLAGECAQWDLPGRPGCVAQMLGSRRLALTFGYGVHQFDPLTGFTHMLRKFPLAPGMRFNEGKPDPRGRLWFGSMQDNFRPDNTPIPVERFIGQLFRLDADGRLEVMAEHIGISNTLAWSPDATRFYFADSLANCIFSYDYDVVSGALSNKRLLLEEPSLGLPDGSAMDIDGCLWNARWGAGKVLRITPDGRIDRQIEVPALQTSSCAFGGPKLDTLFISSARIGMAALSLAQWPLSGSVFAIGGLAQGLPIAPMQWHLQNTALSAGSSGKKSEEIR